MESKYDYVVFDIETTGLHPESDQICEIAAIGVKDGLPQGLFSTLVAIEGSMPEAAGHNIASFDIPFVQAAAAKSGRVFIYPYVIDTLEAVEGAVARPAQPLHGQPARHPRHRAHGRAPSIGGLL